MRVVDIDKLEKSRELVDTAISEYAIGHEIGIPEAATSLARELGVALRVGGAWTGWWSATALRVPPDLDSPIRADESTERMYESAKQVAALILQRTFVARSAYDAAVAAMTYALDESVDVVMDGDEFHRIYGEGEVDRVIEATPMRMSQAELNPTQMLFESDAEHKNRLQRIIIYHSLLILAKDCYASNRPIMGLPALPEGI